MRKSSRAFYKHHRSDELRVLFLSLILGDLLVHLGENNPSSASVEARKKAREGD